MNFVNVLLTSFLFVCFCAYNRNRNKRTPLRVAPIGFRRNFGPPFACCVFFCQVFCAALLRFPDVSYGTIVVRGVALRVLDPLCVCSLFYAPSLGMGHMRTTFYTPLFVRETGAKRPKTSFRVTKLLFGSFLRRPFVLDPVDVLCLRFRVFFTPLRVLLPPIRCLLFVLDPPLCFF